MGRGAALVSSITVASLCIAFFPYPAGAINCYTCSSHNGSDTACEDPFHPARANYSQKCMVPKTGHVGLFPANFCIKITGTNVDTGELKVIRFCAMKTMDSQCGSFRYQNSSMKGCILTCDYDGCNAGTSIRGLHTGWLYCLVLLMAHLCPGQNLSPRF